MSTVDLSVVVPLFNESDNVTRLLDRLFAVLRPLGKAFEVILVDDGSDDSTWATIRNLGAAFPEIRALSFTRNFGHQSALLAGLRVARGRAVVTMDGDLQHPPELIPELVGAWQQGFRVVVTRRRDHTATSWFKHFSSKAFYRAFSLLAGVSLEEGSSDFRLLDRRVLDELLALRDAEWFLRGAVQWLGFEAKVVEFQAAPREVGASKFNLGRMLRFASGAILAFSNKPLRLGIWMGLLTGALAFGEIVYVVFAYLRGNTVSGWASTLAVLSFLFGVLFVMLGIIGAYLARIHRALQDRPKYIVAEVFDSRTDGDSPQAGQPVDHENRN